MTITERCSDPSFQTFISLTHRRWWSQAERRGWPKHEIAEAILRNLCDGEISETHPEVRALVAMFERQKSAQIAEQCQTLNP